MDEDIIVVRGVEYSLPLRRMRLGDSFFLPCLKWTEVGIEVKRAARRYGYRIHARRAEYGSYLGVRCWRVA